MYEIAILRYEKSLKDKFSSFSLILSSKKITQAQGLHEKNCPTVY